MAEFQGSDKQTKVSCDDSNCCSKFSISSSGPIGDKYPEAMTTYEKEDNVNVKPSYSNGNVFLFHHIDIRYRCPSSFLLMDYFISSFLDTLGEITKEGNT